MDGVVASGPRYRQGVSDGGVGASVDDIEAVTDGVLEGVVAAATVEDVVAEAARDDVVAAVAGDGVVGGAADDVLNTDQGIGADVDTLRLADRRVIRIARSDQERADRPSPACGLKVAVGEIEIDGDAVGG